MLTMRYVLILLALLLLCPVSASSQESSKHKPIANPEQKTKHEPTPAKKKIPSVQKIETDIVKEVGQQQKPNTDEHLEIDRKLAEYTRQLAVYTKVLSEDTGNVSTATLGLVFVTAILAAIGIWQGFQLQGSVNLARKEFLYTHRPRIVVRQMKMYWDGSTPMGICYTLHNVGESQATIIRISEFQGIPDPENYVAQKPDYAASITVHYVLLPGDIKTVEHSFEGEETSFVLGFETESLQMRMTDNPSRNMVVLGYVEYIDSLGITRRTAFHREYAYRTKRFEPNPDYEYED